MMTSEHSDSTYSGGMKERFAEVQTRLRRQMIMPREPLVFAGILPLSLNPAHMLSVAKALPPPVHLLLALASVGVGWAAASWWKQSRSTNAAAH
jgi:hypothetical protein